MFRKLIFAMFISSMLYSVPVLAKENFSLGVAYDLGGGITAQYNGYSFFVNGDAIAIDRRFENFTNDNKSVHFYLDLGAYVDKYNGNDVSRDNSVGIRAPVGMTLGISKEVQAYIQAVPNFDFNNSEFNIDGAIGIRYRF